MNGRNGVNGCNLLEINCFSVMKLGLVSMGYLPYVRRRMRRSGLRLTVRWGKVYTVEAVEIRQPETEAQLRARDVMARASAAAKREMTDPERRLYWDSHAAELGYKTARGACVAHHVRRIKAEEEAERQRRSMEVLRAWAEEARQRRERRKRERDEEMNKPVNEEVMRRMMAAEARLQERLRLAERYERRRRRRLRASAEAG